MKTQELRGLAVVGQRLGLSYQRVLKLVIAGELPAQMRGGRWYVKLADLVEFQRQQHAERQVS